MKNKFFIALGVVIVTALIGFNIRQVKGHSISNLLLANVEALAEDYEIDDECPNGCLSKQGNGCYCYTYYPYNEEADWND